MASEKMLSPNTTIWWVPRSGIADIKTPTAAEINAGVNISCAVTTDYTMNATDSDTDDSRSICDNSNVQTPTFDNYEVNIPFFRDANLANTDSVYVKAYNLFAEVDADGYFVRRIGKLSSENAVAGDNVSVFGVSTDYMRSVDGGDDGAPVRFEVKGIPTGELAINVPVVGSGGGGGGGGGDEENG